MRTRFITSAADRGGFVDLGLPEVAFLGRSNVGKSSLLNVLANAKIARTSRTPGRTQLVNFFEVESSDRHVVLADLPGYGYARAPKHIVRSWGVLSESYLEHRAELALALLLIDIRRDVEDEDRALVDYLKDTVVARGGQVRIVGTKTDKLPKAKRKPALHQIAAAFDLPRDAVLGTSSERREGIEALWAEIIAITGASKTD